MKIHFYNTLPLSIYETNDLESITEYIISKNYGNKYISHESSGVFEETNKLGEYSINKSDKQVKEKFIYTNAVSQEFYKYLLNHYSAGLGNNILFNLDLEEDVFGLDKNERKKIGLKYFNFYYNKVPNKIGLKFKFDENRLVVPNTKFEYLKRYQETLINNLDYELELIIPFLAGDNNYYNKNLFDNNTTIKNIFEFENNLKILIELNNQFKLEENDVFATKPISKIIYQKYAEKFHSLKQVEFIENQILKTEKINRAFAICLYDFFNNVLCITMPSAKVFGEIINSYFNFDFSTLKLNGNESNTHRNRVKKIKKDWDNFTN